MIASNHYVKTDLTIVVKFVINHCVSLVTMQNDAYETIAGIESLLGHYENWAKEIQKSPYKKDVEEAIYCVSAVINGIIEEWEAAEKLAKNP